MFATELIVASTMPNQDLFLGMPYAQPPLGDLRWQNPVSLNTSWQGTRNATEYSPECIGFGSDDWVLGNPVSEDCLTINVIRPGGVEPGSNLPVALWVCYTLYSACDLSGHKRPDADSD